MKKTFSTKFGIRGRLVTTFFGLLILLVATFNWLQITAQEQLLQSELRKRTDLMRKGLIDRGRTLAENLIRQAENDLAAYNFSDLYELLVKTDREDPQLDYILLMTREGEVQFHTSRPELYGEKLGKPDDLFAMAQTELAIQDKLENQREQIEVVAPIKVSTQPWGYLRLGFNLDRLREEIRTSEAEMELFNQRRLLQSWLTALGFSLIGIVLVLLIANNIAKPLIELTKISHRLADGDFGAAKSIRGHDRDEVGILAAAFIRMSENLKRSHEQLEIHNRTLESRVEERTQELKQKNLELAAINEDLETLDGIVKAINREFAFDRLIEALLQQGLRMFPPADRCALIMRPPSANRPLLLAMTGIDPSTLERMNEQLPVWLDYFGRHAEKLAGGMARLRGGIPRSPDVGVALPTVEAILSLRLRLGAKDDGFLILLSEKDANAFDRSVMERLVRFREHAVSAISKSHFLEELKDKNEQISKTQQRLVFQAKMASLGTLTAGIAHEIKNPLNFINNFASINAEMVDELQPLLSQALGADHPLRAQIDEQLALFQSNSALIARHGDRADHIIKGMLRLSREASGEFEYIELNRLLDEYVTLAFHGMRAKEAGLSIVFHRNYDPAVGELRVVPEGLGRVFLNIINNACFAVLNDPRIQDPTYTPTIWVETYDRGERVEIQISDNGMGIPQEIKDRIFTPFFTTKPAGEGTGLGLSITYDIIKREHKGEIRVESEPSVLTRFIIQLPRRKLQEILTEEVSVA